MLEMISCGCKSGTCITNRYQCQRHQLKCSNVCRSQNCSHQFEGDKNANTDSASDDESGEESEKLKLTVRLRKNMDAVSGRRSRK